VVLAHGEGAALIVDLLAVWSVGAAAVVVSHGVTPDERVIVRDKTGPRAWVGHAAPAGVAALPPAHFAAEAAESSQPATRLDDVALIMMTSGTTSRPKGVVLTHRALQARLALNIAHIGRDDLAVTLTVLPMHFGHGLIGNSLTPLAAGSQLVVWSEPGSTGLHALGKVADEHGLTFMSSVPSLWRVALKLSPPPGRGTLRRVHVGSAPLAAPLWNNIIAWSGTHRVVNMYGITETANWIGGHSAEDGLPVDGLVGRPWGGAFRVRLANGDFSATGRGEVVVNSPSLMTGYLDLPDLTAQSLAGDWFLTGDIGEIDEAGNLRLVGRSKHEINRGGIKVPAEEIDALLERHPFVVEACAFALPDPLSGETVAAAIVLEPGGEDDAGAIRAWCETRIRREALPSRLFVLPELPRTDRGKLNRDIVREACLAAVSSGSRP
ncbi:MAG: acyl--CoA ligase, partial [Pseudaminobacter sp.]|nr:acyl--CoA ligase [Pseudaminobacter sp.]